MTLSEFKRYLTTHKPVTVIYDTDNNANHYNRRLLSHVSVSIRFSRIHVDPRTHFVAIMGEQTNTFGHRNQIVFKDVAAVSVEPAQVMTYDTVYLTCKNADSEIKYTLLLDYFSI